MIPLTIALIYNLKPEKKSKLLPLDYYSECDSAKTVAAIAQALESAGHRVLPVEADRRLPVWLTRHPVDLAFNIAEGFHGESREARVPALLDLLGIPFTGSGVLALALCLDKFRSKQIFCQSGIPTPKFQFFSNPKEPLSPRLHFPLIVKPNREGSGKGIWADSVVLSEEALRCRMEKVFELYRQEVLVEEFVEGTELTVGILGKDRLLPVLEIDFSDCRPSGEYFYSWRMKEFQGNKKLHLVPRFFCPARLEPQVSSAVQQVAFKGAQALGCRDFARVDIRLSSDGIPYVLEVNPLPGLDPEESNLPIMARAAGIRYEALVNQIANLAIERSLGAKENLQAPSPSGNGAGALSSDPSSKKNVPISSLPRRRALPDSRRRPSGSPEPPAVVALRSIPPKLEGSR